MSLDIIYDSGPGGMCPVQAEGTVNGLRFYFRARGTTWSLSIRRVPGHHDDIYVGRNCMVFTEEYRGTHFRPGGQFEAGYAEPWECVAFIDRAAAFLLGAAGMLDNRGIDPGVGGC